MTTLGAIEKWLYQTLWNDAEMRATYNGRTLAGVFAYVAPQTGAQESAAREMAPAVVFSLASGGADERVLCGQPFVQNPAYLVRVVGKRTGFEPLSPWETRLDALLSGARAASGAVGAGSPVFEVWRESPYRLVDAQNGTPFFETGGVYRFSVALNVEGF